VAFTLAVDQVGNVLESYLNQVWALDERAGRYCGGPMTPGRRHRIDRNPAGRRQGGRGWSAPAESWSRLRQAVGEEGHARCGAGATGTPGA
jgi:hypothetical protein